MRTRTRGVAEEYRMATIYPLKMLHDSLSPPLPSLLKRFSIAIVSTRTKEGMISSGFVQRTRGIDIFFRVVAEGNTGYYRRGGYYERLLYSSPPLPFFPIPSAIRNFAARRISYWKRKTRFNCPGTIRPCRSWTDFNRNGRKFAGEKRVDEEVARSLTSRNRFERSI